jgi:hypothetical protein
MLLTGEQMRCRSRLHDQPHFGGGSKLSIVAIIAIIVGCFSAHGGILTDSDER